MDDFITYLKDELFLQLLRHCEQEHILRIWMMGQATAEEPYLLAMSLADLLGTELADWNIKIFATFRQEEATAAARRFTFSEEQLAQLPALYQQQFFERVAAGNRGQPYAHALAKPVRHLVIFGVHDLLYHPPLAHMHLLFGQHVLDPFSLPVQEALLSRFATSLTGGGLLLLGPQAPMQPHPHVYELVEPRWKLYRCRAVHPVAASNLSRQPLKNINGTFVRVSPDLLLSQQEQAFARDVASLPWKFHGLGVLVVNRNCRIMFLDTVAARLLDVPQEVVGQDFAQTLSGLPESLLRMAIETIFAQHIPLKLSLMAHEQRPSLMLQLAQLHLSETEPPLVAILISEVRELSPDLLTAWFREQPGEASTPSEEQLEAMHETLHLADEQLQTRVALLQATLERAEQMSEMLQVTNEELQATNEELEITSTEIETDNLELQTVSRELRARLEEQQRARLQLEELNRLKDDFIGIASHEIKTPLTSILGNVQLAMRHISRLTPGDMEPIREQQQIQHALQRTQVHIRRLTRLVNDLLDTSRIEAGTLQLCFDRCDLTAIVRDIVEEQRQLTPQPHLALTLPQHPLEVRADADRIGQVVSDYLSNALKYNASNQVVEVILQEEDHAGRLLVRDHGPGLSLPEQKRVWERFYRVPGIEARNGSGIGLGLGLAICRFIIERHRGQVGVESMQGQGATFWFTLPITAQQAAN